MAITNATRLSDFGAGIGTQGAIIQVDNANARLGIGTTNPTAMLSVGPNAGIIMDGIAGVITATSIAASATGLTGTPSVTVNLVSATDVNVSGSATIDGHLSVAGTITHEDVTNVDSVGIVTARQGVRVLAGGIQVVGLTTGLRASGISTFGGGSGGDIQIQGSASGVTSCLWNASDDRFEFYDNSKATFGDGADMAVYHNGTNSYIDNSTGDFYIRGVDEKWLYIQAKSGENSIICKDDDAVELYYDNNKKFNTAGAGVSITGGVQVSSGGTFGSHNANAAVYYGDGSNLTGIAQGVAGINTTGFSTFKDVSIQGITTFSNLTDASSTTSAAVVISGGVGVAKSMYVGGNIHFANGKGIDFSAVSNGSGTTDNEVLKQYEYGTWTPQDDGDSDISTGIGNYCLVGQVCYLVASFNSNNPSGSTTHIRNLPVNPRRLAYNHHTFGLLFKIPGGGGDESGLSLYICAINTHSTSGGFHIVTDHSDFANTDYSGFNATYTIEQM